MNQAGLGLAVLLNIALCKLTSADLNWLQQASTYQ